MQRAQPVPFGGIGAEIVASTVLPALLDGIEPLEIALDRRVGSVQPRNHSRQKVANPVAVGQAEVGPRTFLVTMDEIGFQKQLQVSRDRRLRLAENFSQVGNGEVSA